MIFDVFKLLLAGGAAGATLVALPSLTTQSIVENARLWWGSNVSVVVIDPSAHAELSRIARRHGTKRYRRFVHHLAMRETRLVESDLISSDLAHQSRRALYIS